MSVAYPRGKQLGADDLNIFLEDSSGRPANAQEISYAIYDFTTGLEVLVGPPRRSPANPQVGCYYASIVIPLGANIGPYRIRWTFREVVGGPINQVVQEFDVIDQEIIQTPLSDCLTDLVRSMRILLRDFNPDRNYHFRPPTHEATIDQFSRVFGYIWEDEELIEYLKRATDMVSAAPPATPFRDPCSMMQCYPYWRTLLLDGAMMHALFALQLNWIADEFDYSVGGISLSIEKSSKYQSAYDSKKQSWDEELDRAKQTVKIVKGLQQPRFGVGIRSAFGPYTSAGVLTPRKFVSF